MSMQCKDPANMLSKIKTYGLGTSNAVDDNVTQILPMKFGPAALDIELDLFRETWNHFKLLLLKSKPTSVVQSLFLLELESYVRNGGLENNLGLSASELRNFDSFLAKFEDHSIPVILLKFEKFKSLSLHHELTGSNFNHENGADGNHIKQKIKFSKLVQTEDGSAHINPDVTDLDDDASKHRFKCELKKFKKSGKRKEKKTAVFMTSGEKSKNEMIAASTVFMCGSSCQSQSEQAALVTSPTIPNDSSVTRKQKRCDSETMTDSFKAFDSISDSCSASEIVREESPLLQPFCNSEMKLNNACLTGSNFNLSQNSNKSEVRLRSHGNVMHIVNYRLMIKYKQVSCPVCGFQCESTTLLKGHMKQHTDSGKHRCSICKAVFKQRASLEYHLEACVSHTKNNPSNLRSATSDSNVVLDSVSKQCSDSKHLRDEESLKNSPSNCKLPFSSRTCTRSFSVHCRHKSHVKKHLKYKQLKCETCRRTFHGLAKLKRHKLTHTGEKPFNCKVCGTAFADKSHLNVHLRVHSGEKPFKCDICESSFSESTKLKNHRRVHTGEKPFVCEVCGCSFSVSSSLRSHMKIHTGERPYKCNVCDFASAHSSNLKAHLLIHTGEKKYSCDKCGALFTETAKLKRHKMVHTGERPCSCEVCGARFADKSHLTVHLRIHSGEKPFKCTFCSSAFVESSKLKNHLRTHTGEKPYVCEICGTSFAVSYSLKSHMRCHTGEKPYKCDICGYATSQSSNLKTHMIVHNEARPHVCDICCASFSELSKLNRHKLIHQDQQEESSLNHVSLDQNNEQPCHSHHRHLLPDCRQKHNFNSLQDLILDSIPKDLKSVSDNSSYPVHVANVRHRIKKSFSDTFTNSSEAKYPNTVQPYVNSLATMIDGSTEASGAISLPRTVKMLEHTNNKISDSENFQFSLVYKEEHISDSILHVDLGAL